MELGKVLAGGVAFGMSDLTLVTGYVVTWLLIKNSIPF